MPKDDPLTPEEQDFRDLLATPDRLHAFAEAARQRWETSREGRDHLARCYREVGGFRQPPPKEQRHGR